MNIWSHNSTVGIFVNTVVFARDRTYVHDGWDGKMWVFTLVTLAGAWLSVTFPYTYNIQAYSVCTHVHTWCTHIWLSYGDSELN